MQPAETPAPRVSVVVLTWNRRSLLELTLESVLSQDGVDLEVLVVDNESTDDTSVFVTALAERDPRVRYFRNANGGVLSVNRNFAFERARGEWVALCDDDDLWEPGKLARQLAEAERFPEADIIGTNAVYFSQENGAEQVVYGTLVERAEDGWVDLRTLTGAPRTQVVNSSVIMRASLLADVGPWDTDPAVFTVEDIAYWIRSLARGHRIRVIADSYVRFRVHPGASSAADTRVTAAKLVKLAEKLRADGVLDEAQYRVVSSGFARRARSAAFKEALKRVPGLKAAVYRDRARRAGGEVSR